MDNMDPALLPSVDGDVQICMTEAAQHWCTVKTAALRAEADLYEMWVNHYRRFLEKTKKTPGTVPPPRSHTPPPSQSKTPPPPPASQTRQLSNPVTPPPTPLPRAVDPTRVPEPRFGRGSFTRDIPHTPDGSKGDPLTIPWLAEMNTPRGSQTQPRGRPKRTLLSQSSSKCSANSTPSSQPDGVIDIDAPRQSSNSENAMCLPADNEGHNSAASATMSSSKFTNSTPFTQPDALIDMDAPRQTCNSENAMCLPDDNQGHNSTASATKRPRDDSQSTEHPHNKDAPSFNWHAAAEAEAETEDS